VVDHVGCAHAFAGFDRLFPGRGRYDCRKVEHVAGHLDGSAADSPAAIDLISRGGKSATNPRHIDLDGMEARITTYDQDTDVLFWLDLKPIMERLISGSKGQTITRRLDEIERLRLVSAAELADELVFCIAPLANRGSDVGHIIAWLVELAVRTNLHDCTGAVVADDVEIFGNTFIIVLFALAGEHPRHSGDGASYLVHRRRLHLEPCNQLD